ncbi:MAG: GxxExxY protein [Candidatus Giovannonibacteria bacterium]|nr:MAG: GxxExxY protein [Candidatus Giovannonibacteria bacterium]
MNTKKEIRTDLIYPELSYKIIGILFDVYNQLGYGYQEKYYEKATAAALKLAGLNYKEQYLVPLKFKDEKIGNYFLDFLVDDKVVLELKRGERVAKSNIDQIYAYLIATGLKLGILAQFTPSGIKFRRILNIK